MINSYFYPRGVGWSHRGALEGLGALIRCSPAIFSALMTFGGCFLSATLCLPPAWWCPRSEELFIISERKEIQREGKFRVKGNSERKEIQCSDFCTRDVFDQCPDCHPWGPFTSISGPTSATFGDRCCAPGGANPPPRSVQTHPGPAVLQPSPCTPQTPFLLHDNSQIPPLHPSLSVLWLPLLSPRKECIFAKSKAGTKQKKKRAVWYYFLFWAILN